MNLPPHVPARIAIPVPTSGDPEYNLRSWAQYALAVERSGGVAVKIPLDPSPAATARLVAGCSGVLLPGSGADVDPGMYSQEPTEACAEADPAREAVDRLLLEDAEKHGKPVLAICFGTQMLNVWRGGTLVQDLICMPVNHKAGRSVGVAHSVDVAPHSFLGELVAGPEAPEQEGFLRLPVNSSHHQAIGLPADGLRVSARSSEDGVIEAVESSLEASEGSPIQFLVGVQWHPERTFDESAASRALFRRLMSEAVTWTEAAAANRVPEMAS